MKSVNLTSEEIKLIKKALINQKMGKKEDIIASNIIEKLTIKK